MPRRPPALTAIGDLLYWIMQIRQLANLMTRAERAHRIAGDMPEPARDMSPAGVG
jgi:hypothetical protein